VIGGGNEVGETAGDEVNGDDDAGGGAVAGPGLAGDAQATSNSPTTILVPIRESEWRIPCPPDGML